MSRNKIYTIVGVLIVLVGLLCKGYIVPKHESEESSTESLQDHENSGENLERFRSVNRVKSHDEQSQKAFDILCSDIEAIEVDMENFDFEAFHVEVEKKFQKISDPRTLELIFWKNVFDPQEVANREGKIGFQNPVSPSRVRVTIMYRLAELKTEEAARVLIDLRFNKKARWDAGSSFFASRAVLQSGKLALPYLEEVETNSGGYLKREATRLIDLIRKGEK